MTRAAHSIRFFLPALLLLLPASAFAKWVSPTARPYVAFVGTFSDTDEVGLKHFQSETKRNDVMSQAGLEIGVPLAGELTVFGRLTSTRMAPFRGDTSSELKIWEPTLGISYAYPLFKWLLPAAAVAGGMGWNKVKIGGSQVYSAVDWVPVASARGGLELRSPGLVFRKADPEGFFGQGSLALFVGYGYTMRGTVELGALSMDGEHEGTVHGPDPGTLELSGHGFDVRLHFRF